MKTQTDKQQIEYSKEAKVLAAQYRAIGNPAFSMGKLCTICGGPVLNASKVLTCQDCRHDQHLSSASVASDSPNHCSNTGLVLRTMYKVNTGPRRNRYFKTLQRAKVYCAQVFERSRVVLSIVETKH